MDTPGSLRKPASNTQLPQKPACPPNRTITRSLARRGGFASSGLLELFQQREALHTSSRQILQGSSLWWGSDGHLCRSVLQNPLS